MKGRTQHQNRHLTGVAMTMGVMLAILPGSTAATDPLELPACSAIRPADVPDGVVVSPWEVLLDADGAVTGHRMKLRRDGVETTVRTGRRGFSQDIGTDRVLVGSRSDVGTRLAMIDTSQGCRTWARSLDRLAYTLEAPDDGTVHLSIHEPKTRDYFGTLLIDAETGATNAMIDDECATTCEPNDGEVPPAVFAPASLPRPVPNFTAGGWAKDKTLGFRWGAGSAPPAWATGPLKSAADDALRTAAARSPRFVYRKTAANSIRYTGTFPSYCGAGIACASRSMPKSWGVWLRPHGTDFGWGTLRWCQKNSSSSGCFDIRRVALHELGHITGLHHPESAGFRLAAHETVMHAVTPAKPQPASTRHAFGRCDVATLQELYDVPGNRTPISTCNSVDSKLTLSASKTSISRGGSVELRAELRIAAHSAYRQLAGNPLNSRSVKLKYRRTGSGAAWTTAWMKSLNNSGRYELTITPQASWEFKATFPAPKDEGLLFSRSEIVKVKVHK